MPLSARTLLAATLLAAFPALALAGASPASFNYTPDPGLMTAGKGELEQRVRRGCAVTQARLQNAAESAVTRPCGCYASRVMRSLDWPSLTRTGAPKSSTTRRAARRSPPSMLASSSARFRARRVQAAAFT